MLKTRADIAFGKGVEPMLKDKSLKQKKQEMDKIEAEVIKVFLKI